MRLEKYIPNEYKFFTSYGRTALLATLYVLQVRGKKVLLPAYTCNTTVTSAVLQAGGIPVFVEISVDDFSMNIEDLNRKIDSQCRVLISHHYYGVVNKNVGVLAEICKEKGIFHIEDCCHVLGEKYQGKYAGISGDVSIYSFSKALPNMGGGCVSTNNKEFYDKLVKCYEKNGNIMTKLLKNMNLYYHYGSNLARYIKEPFHFKVFKVLCWKVNKILFSVFYLINGAFYTQNEYECFDKIDKMDVKMGVLQRWFIDKRMDKFEEVAQSKREKAMTIKSNLDGLIHNIGESECPMYLLVVSSDETKHEKCIQLWPVFQKYFNEQYTENVNYIMESYQGIDLYSYVCGDIEV